MNRPLKTGLIAGIAAIVAVGAIEAALAGSGIACFAFFGGISLLRQRRHE